MAVVEARRADRQPVEVLDTCRRERVLLLVLVQRERLEVAVVGAQVLQVGIRGAQQR